MFMSGLARFRVPQGTAYASCPKVAVRHAMRKERVDAKKVHNVEDANEDHGRQEVNNQSSRERAAEEAVKLSAEFDRLVRSAELHVQENEGGLPCLGIHSQGKNAPLDFKEGTLEWVDLAIRQVCQICLMLQKKSALLKWAEFWEY